jgi:hypothetical protein
VGTKGQSLTIAIVTIILWLLTSKIHHHNVCWRINSGSDPGERREGERKYERPQEDHSVVAIIIWIIMESKETALKYSLSNSRKYESPLKDLYSIMCSSLPIKISVASRTH